MEISLILMQKIVSLFLTVALGVIIVKCKLLKPEDSRVFSVISLYLAFPCTVISAFLVERTEMVMRGLLLSVLASLGTHAIAILLTEIIGRIWPLKPIEKVSVIYSNSAGLVIPLIWAVLGSEWVLYSSGFVVVQQLFIWSHGKKILCSEERPDFLKMVKNPNVIAVFAGFLILALNLRIPVVIKDTMGYLADMLIASGLLVTGMLIGDVNWKEISRFKNVWFICFLRLILCPAVCLLFLRFSGIAGLAVDGIKILLVIFLATATPSSMTVMMMAQVYQQDAEYGSIINILTTALYVLTVPVLLLFYPI